MKKWSSGMFNSILFVFFLTWSAALLGASVDTITVFSKSMHKETRCVIILPEHDEGERMPVLYLLHGFGGDHRSWLKVNPDLPRLADSLKLMIVCPNGERSWYLDSPVDTTVRLETYMTKELVPFIDEHYETIATKNARAIAGLSMGGHGSLYLAMRHPDLFGTVCSTSGSVDLHKISYSHAYRKLVLGHEQKQKDNWNRNSVLTLAQAFKPIELHVMFDCGTEDEWLEANRNLHRIFLERHIPHDYVERPGGHDAAYWSNSIDYMLLYIQKNISRK